MVIVLPPRCGVCMVLLAGHSHAQLELQMVRTSHASKISSLFASVNPALHEMNSRYHWVKVCSSIVAANTAADARRLLPSFPPRMRRHVMRVKCEPVSFSVADCGSMSLCLRCVAGCSSRHCGIDGCASYVAALLYILGCLTAVLRVTPVGRHESEKHLGVER